MLQLFWCSLLCNTFLIEWKYNVKLIWILLSIGSFKIIIYKAIEITCNFVLINVYSYASVRGGGKQFLAFIYLRKSEFPNTYLSWFFKHFFIPCYLYDARTFRTSIERFIHVSERSYSLFILSDVIFWDLL